MFKEANIATLADGTSFFEYDDYDFEFACKYLLEKSGRFHRIQVTEKGPQGGDQGVDLKIRSSDGVVTEYGQCKLWQSRYHGLIHAIRELAGCMYRDKVNQGILIVTVDANEYEKKEAARCNIELIDLPQLDEIICTVQAKNFPEAKDSARRAKNKILKTVINQVIAIIVLLLALKGVLSLLLP